MTENNIQSLIVRFDDDEGQVSVRVGGQPYPIRYGHRDNEVLLSVVDFVAAVTGHDYQRARNYWNVLKSRLEAQGSELVTFCNRLKLTAADGKQRETDVATVEGMLRIIQTIPSPRAEPAKRWLALVGRERLEENADPELGITRGIQRAQERYSEQGQEDLWQQARLQGVMSRNAFTRALAQAVGDMADVRLFAQSTNDIYQGIFGYSAKELRDVLQLASQDNPRDHLSGPALHLVGLVEAVCATYLSDQDRLVPSQARVIIQDVARIVGVGARHLENRVGRDFLSESHLRPA